MPLLARAKSRRSVTGFRLDSNVLNLFQARLRVRGMAMQPLMESWVKRWLELDEPSPEAGLREIRQRQDELRALVEALAARL